VGAPLAGGVSFDPRCEQEARTAGGGCGVVGPSCPSHGLRPAVLRTRITPIRSHGLRPPLPAMQLFGLALCIGYYLHLLAANRNREAISPRCWREPAPACRANLDKINLRSGRPSRRLAPLRGARQEQSACPRPNRKARFLHTEARRAGKAEPIESRVSRGSGVTRRWLGRWRQLDGQVNSHRSALRTPAVSSPRQRIKQPSPCQFW